MFESGNFPLLALGFLVWWILASVAVSVAADVRGRRRGPWFWLSVLVGPFLAVLLLIAFPAKFEEAGSRSQP